MPGLSFPPFPQSLPTQPLLVVDYSLVAAGESQEIEKLWKAATELGFWYLKNHGTDAEVEEMFDMGEATLALPQEEKDKFVKEDGEFSFGHTRIKSRASAAINGYGSPDNAELLDISKDDALAYPKTFHRTYPSTVNAHMESAIVPFTRKALDIIDTFFNVFETKLGLPAGALRALHKHMEASGSQARCTKSPPQRTIFESPFTKQDDFLGAHTDIGSMSFLHNRFGGMQVLPSGSSDWQHVVPIPGHAICNIGDTLSIFSGGILHSNLHRTVPSLGAQAEFTRWSMGYFSHPANDVQLRPLDESDMVKNALSLMGPEERAMYFPNMTQGDWYARSLNNVEFGNRMGPETYHANRAIEYMPHVI